MTSPSKSRGLFRRAFREASPIFGRSLNDSNEPEIEPNVQINEEEIEFARRMTSSIERLTDIARRDSFSSISSYGQREQFKTALTNIHSSLIGEKEKTPIMDHKPQPSGSNDSDHDFEHLDAPDPFELASYHAAAAGNADAHSKPQAMSHDSPHNISPEHHAASAINPEAHAQHNIYSHEEQQHHHSMIPETRHYENDYFNEPADPIVEIHGDNHQHNILGHNKEEMLIDFDSEEPVAHPHPYHHEQQTYNETQINTDPEPPNVHLFDSPIHHQHHDFDEQQRKSPEIDHRRFNDSPQFPDEPSPARAPAHRGLDEDDYQKNHPARYSPDQEDRKSIEENIHAAVNDTHDEVDAILERLHTPDPAEVAVPPVPEHEEHNSPDSERDTVGNLVGESYNEPEPNMPASDSTHGMRETSPDEQTFDRRGPLTIPTHNEKQRLDSPPHDQAPSAPADDDFEPVSASSNFHQIPPRPPTPPKDLDDEDVKPPAIDLGPAPVHHYEKSPDDTSGLKPILKHHSDVEPWLNNNHVDHRVLDIIYWRDPKKSGITLGAIFVTLLLLCKFSLISLVAYSAIAVLVATLGFRLFKIAEAKFKKTDDKNPFQPLLEKELDVPQEKIHAQVDVLVENARSIALQLRRLFLVENVVDSVKFFFLLYSLTYIGAWFSGFALIILFVIGVFTIPKVYEINKEPIDNYLNLAKENVDKLHHTVGEKLPFLKQASVAPPAKKEE